MMMQRAIGKIELRVHAIGLGSMPLSIAGRPDAGDGARVIRRFVALGGQFIDTANVYCVDDGDIGHSERLIRGVLRELGSVAESVVVATKGGLRRPRGEWTVDGSPAWLRASCEKSLDDLGVGCITLYQLHAVDSRIGLEASLHELMCLRERGLIRHIGVSNVTLEQLRTALKIAPVVSVQNRCNVFAKQDFRNGMIEFCGMHGVTYIAYSPVGGHHGHVRLPREPLMMQLSESHRCSPYAVALAWLLAKGEHILPIPGASKVASVEDSFSATDVRLTSEDIAAIDRLPDAP